ncbi:Protein of unknown function [Escherichia coli D6-117.29]|nr:Protein of unknown function [Escherichia coli D6-113.11]CDP72843.1 Protein of unknown function [Escherichia coli]CDP77338.1 Protein of unknown function [Escherichia coli D6-117.29]CDU32735.1 Protein of unknown function [Escherichia coli D6-113.11]CDU40034.1 Protein of unknown function [Escherichia coli]
MGLKGPIFIGAYYD